MTSPISVDNHKHNVLTHLRGVLLADFVQLAVQLADLLLQGRVLLLLPLHLPQQLAVGSLQAATRSTQSGETHHSVR